MDKIGILPIEWKFLNKNATIIERAFSKLGIYAYIDEATGYFKEKKKNEYKELFNRFLEEEALKWEKVFTDEFFDIIWKIWLQKTPNKNNKRPSFFGHIINKYVYSPLAIKELNSPIKEAGGILLKELQNKNPIGENKHRKYKHTQFLNKIGKEVIREHLIKITTIGKISNDKRTFDKNFARLFGIEGESLFDEE